MKKLLHAELSMVAKNWLLLGIILLITALCSYLTGHTATAFTPHPNYSVEYLNQMFGKDLRSVKALLYWQDGYEIRSIFFGMLVPLWSGSVLAAFFIGQDFENRTITLPLLAGHTRIDVYAGKLFCYYLIGLTTSQVSLYTTLMIYRPDWVTALRFSDILRYALLRILADLATLSIPCLIAFLCRDLVKTVSVSAAYAVVLTYLILGSSSDQSVLHRALSYHPAYQFKELMLNRFPFYSDLNRMLLVSFGVLVVTTTAGYVLFRKMALK